MKKRWLILFGILAIFYIYNSFLIMFPVKVQVLDNFTNQPIEGVIVVRDISGSTFCPACVAGAPSHAVDSAEIITNSKGIGHFPFKIIYEGLFNSVNSYGYDLMLSASQRLEYGELTGGIYEFGSPPFIQSGITFLLSPRESVFEKCKEDIECIAIELYDLAWDTDSDVPCGYLINATLDYSKTASWGNKQFDMLAALAFSCAVWYDNKGYATDYYTNVDYLWPTNATTCDLLAAVNDAFNPLTNLPQICREELYALKAPSSHEYVRSPAKDRLYGLCEPSVELRNDDNKVKSCAEALKNNLLQCGVMSSETYEERCVELVVNTLLKSVPDWQGYTAY